MPIDRLAPHIERALNLDGLQLAYTDERLRLAFELWTAYHREHSLRAKFLTLVMALEVLSPPISKHEVAIAFTDRWNAELTAAMQDFARGSDEHDALESLRREVCFRRDRSIRGALRAHVLNVVNQCEPESGTRIAALAVRAYDLRGALVHEGRLGSADLSEGHQAARESVRALLLAMLGIPPRLLPA